MSAAVQKRPRPPRSKNAERFRGIVRDIAEMAHHAVDAPLLDENERETPASVFNTLNVEFDFTLDVAASHQNHKLPRYCTHLGRFDNGAAISHLDGLSGEVWAGERVWCNPPYTDLHLWVSLAWHANADVAVVLLPNNRAEQPFWQDLIEPYRDRPGSVLTTRNLAKRRPFGRRVNGELVMGKSPPFGLVVAIWDRRNPLIPF
jgi:hypothetical protein